MCEECVCVAGEHFFVNHVYIFLSVKVFSCVFVPVLHISKGQTTSKVFSAEL